MLLERRKRIRNDKRDITLDSKLISKQGLPIFSIPNINLFEELPNSYQINQFVETVKKKRKSKEIV